MNRDEYVVEMRGISKRFPGILANDRVNLSLKKGEILALLGENGAGKSTLMSILFGFYHADEGQIFIRGKEEKINSPNKAYDLGIGMVHQHFKLIDNFTVTENIMLGNESVKNALFVDEATAREKVRKLSEQYGLNINPDARIEDCSVGMQQRVEILKVLYRNADIIILDEPTAVLTPQEIDELMVILRNFTAEGKSIILITHKLREIMQVADRVTVLRRGKMTGTLNVRDTNEDELARLMVGRHVNFKVDKSPSKPGRPVLEIQDLVVRDARKLKAVDGFTLTVHAGEIVGVAGVDGNGQEELVQAIAGLMPIESGRIVLDGHDISEAKVRERNEIGLGHIPADRQKYGLIMDFTLAENMALKSYFKAPLSKRGVLNRPLIRSQAEELSKTFDVRSGEGPLSLARMLSGGNQQKAIIAREFATNPVLMVAAQPTRGLDVGAIEYIHRRLVELRDEGKAILLVSFELDEVMNLSDRIAVIYEGRVSGLVNAGESDERELGLMMSGSLHKGVESAEEKNAATPSEKGGKA